MNVEYRVPAMSSSGNPIRWTGQGSLEISEQGIEVKANKKSGFIDGGCLIALAVVGGIALMAVVGAQLGLESDSFLMDVFIYGGISLMGAGVFAAMRGQKNKAQKQGDAVEHAFTWSEVKSVRWDELTQCLVLKIKSKKVKGMLHIVQPNGSDLQLKLQECVKASK